MSAVVVSRRRPSTRRASLKAKPESEVSAAAISSGKKKTLATIPFLLDFYPLEDSKFSALSPFFEGLRAGRWTTTRCRKDRKFLWPPRIVCPICHSDDLEWVDLPREGHLYAFSAILAGAPLGMENDLPIVVGLIDLDGVPLRIFSRIMGRSWRECRVGQKVQVEPFELPDGRMYYRFRTVN